MGVVVGHGDVHCKDPFFLAVLRGLHEPHLVVRGALAHGVSRIVTVKIVVDSHACTVVLYGKTETHGRTHVRGHFGCAHDERGRLIGDRNGTGIYGERTEAPALKKDLVHAGIACSEEEDALVFDSAPGS